MYADPVLVGSPDASDSARQAKAATWAGRLREAGIPAEATPTLIAELWAKVLYNGALNPLGALLGADHGDLADDPDTRVVMDAVIDETFAVAHSDAILPWVDAAAYNLYSQLVPSTAGHRSSMLQDIERGRPTEIDAINGEVAARGAARGIPTPVNATLTRLVRARARSRPGEETRWKH